MYVRGVVEPQTDAEQAGDWDAVWETVAAFREDDVTLEERGLRWRVQERLTLERYGRFGDLRVIEIGAGRATNALLYARRGARATVLDSSPTALAQAREAFDRFGLVIELVEADVFELPQKLVGTFDVSMSFGLCEHSSPSGA